MKMQTLKGPEVLMSKHFGISEGRLKEGQGRVYAQAVSTCRIFRKKKAIPSKGGSTLQAHTDCPASGFRNVQVSWERFEVWVKAIFTKDRIVGIILAMATTVMGGAIIYALYKAMQGYPSTGLGNTAFGIF